MAAARVVRVESHLLRVVDVAWPFATNQAERIAGHWQNRLAQNPAFFNGTIYVLHAFELSGGHLTGDLLRTDFASFLYWKEQGYPDSTVWDCFGSALLRSSDGHIILGRQAPGHINSGLTYCPGGFIDHRDVGADGTVDMNASVARELVEELGLEPDAFAPQLGAYLTFDGQLLSIAIEYVTRHDAATLLQAARRHIAKEAQSELEDVVAVATRDDFSHLAMPGFTRTLLQTLLA